jgi:hypothetical protein
MHEDQFEAIIEKLDRIEGYFMGDPDKPGIFTELKLLKDFRGAVCRILWIVCGTAITAIVVAVITEFTKKG